MTTPPEDVDALFDAPAAPPSPVQPAEPLAGAPSIEGRKEPRVKVSWPARVLLPNGKVVDLRMRDLSESGIGVLSGQHIPANVVLNFAVGVPGLNDPTKITAVTGTVKWSYVVLKGNDLMCGGVWVTLPPEGRELLDKWIRRLRK